jgi:large subunit ribosomal protein L37Ae
MGRTSKVDSTGRFGSRYGVGIRKRVLKIETQQRESKKCPVCGLSKLKRKKAGIYFCSKCKREFAGGAYVPETMTGSFIKKMVSQKQFSVESDQLKEEEQTEIKEKEPKKEPKKEKLLDKAKSVLGLTEKPFLEKKQDKTEQKKEDKK